MLTQDNSRLRVAGLYFSSLHHSLGAEERIEIRYKLPGEGQPMRRKFFSDPMEAARYSVSREGDEVFAGAGTRLGESGTRAGVARLFTVWGDLDAKGDHTAEDRLRQLAQLPYHPSLVVSSGGGYHAFWLLREPVEGPAMDQAERTMQRLAKGLDADPVHDRSRILRVPGTKNYKYGEPRPVQIEALHPDRRYDLAELQEMADSLPGEPGGDSTNAPVPREVLSEPIHENRRNLSLTSVAGSLRDRGLDVETIFDVLIEVNHLRCVPPLTDEEVTRIARSIGRYPPGGPRYRRSPVRRVHKKEER